MQPKYLSLNGLRAYSAIGIVVMHILANIQVKPSTNYLTLNIIPRFADFTLLFMIISGFSMCCGYYERLKSGNFSLKDFYIKRYKRILPFFFLLTLIDIIHSCSLSSLCEGFTNITLLFGLLPQCGNITVIGVGWFLGIVFLFYIIFPFFVALIDNKTQAWWIFLLSIIIAVIGNLYFQIERKNILYCLPFFITGGIIYLYKDVTVSYTQRHKTLMKILILAISIIYFFSLKYYSRSIIFFVPYLLLFGLWVTYSIGTNSKLLHNKFINYISNISLEIYLCHMLIYRIIENLDLYHYIPFNNIFYLITIILTLVGSIIFSHIAKYIILPHVIK